VLSAMDRLVTVIENKIIPIFNNSFGWQPFKRKLDGEIDMLSLIKLIITKTT
jgi:hypothetical protein